MPSSSPIRVLIVDDSYFMRKVLKDLLSEDGQIQVLDTAQTGEEAVEKTLALKPDVITMDFEMPRMDGLEALERIMIQRPTPVVMVSSHTGQGTEITLRALEIGAVDCVAKPTGRALENIRSLQPELIEKIKVAAVSRPRPRSVATPERPDKGTAPKEDARTRKTAFASMGPASFIAAIASSTGGPKALHELFIGLKAQPQVSYVIVQHISVGFTQALARRLAEVSSLPVTEVEAGEALLGGQVYVAPTGLHLVVEGTPGHFRFAFSDVPPRLGVKPCADILMASVAKVARDRCLGIVLTGMGKDGTAGLKAIQEAGGRTFAQDAESCVVYGMPKSAMEAGVVDRQLALPLLAEEVNAQLAQLKAR